MSLTRHNEVIPEELQTEQNRPHFLLPQPWLAKATLFMERLVWNNRDQLKKIGLDISKLPFWKRYQLLDSEKKGLPTNEKGSWESTFFLTGKDEESVGSAQNIFASSMIWEMTKRSLGEGATLALDLDIKTDKSGQVSDCLPKLTKQEWPMTVRVLKQGLDGKPVGFVDMVFEWNPENPLSNISWERITANDELYISGLEKRARISQTRSLDDWYVEGNVPDKYGEFYRPDIILGQNIEDFSLHQMTADRRPLLTIGLEQRKGRVCAVTVGTQTHLPFNGMDMMGMKLDASNPITRDAAFEATVKNPELLTRIDGSADPGELADYKKNWNENRPKTRGVSSFLANRFRGKDEANLDQRTQIEYYLTFGSFEERQMAQLANLVDVQKVVHSRELPPDLAKWLIELPKKISKMGKHKISGITLLNIAMYMSENEAQGFAIGPNVLDAIRGELGYESVGGEVLERTDKARKIISGNENFEKANKYTEQLRAISDLIGFVQGDKDSKTTIGKLETLINESILNEKRTFDVEYAKEILDQYELELAFINSPQRIKNHVRLDVEPWSFNPTGGLLQQLDVQTHYFDALRACLVEGNTDLDSLNEWSSKLFNLSDPIDHFGFGREEIISILNQVNKDYLRGKLQITENGVVWGSVDRNVILERIERVEKVLSDKAIEKFKQNGITYLLGRKKQELKNLDEIGVLAITEELTAQVGLIADIAKEIEIDPSKAVSSVKDRLGIMAGLEGLGLFGAAGLVADSRPQQNASKMVVKCPPGIDVVFQTALAGSHTTVGVGQVNNTISRKEVLDNPMEAFEVVLPYLRANPDLKRELIMYLVRSNAKPTEVELITRMLESDEYATFADQGRENKTNNIGSQEIWGEDYIARKKGAAINMWGRIKLQKESRILIKRVNELLQKSANGEVLLMSESPRLLAELMNGGYREIWESMNEYKLANIQTNLAQVALVLGLYIKANGNDPMDDEMLLSLREIQKRELTRQSEMMSVMRDKFIGPNEIGGN